MYVGHAGDYFAAQGDVVEFTAGGEVKKEDLGKREHVIVGAKIEGEAVPEHTATTMDGKKSASFRDELVSDGWFNVAAAIEKLPGEYRDAIVMTGEKSRKAVGSPSLSIAINGVVLPMTSAPSAATSAHVAGTAYSKFSVRFVPSHGAPFEELAILEPIQLHKEFLAPCLSPVPRQTVSNFDEID